MVWTYADLATYALLDTYASLTGGDPGITPRPNQGITHRPHGARP